MIPVNTVEKELGLVRDLPFGLVKPSPENDTIYRPIDPDDPELQSLVKSIQKHGILHPLSITCDGYILSGHRRYAAAKLAGVDTLPCLVVEVGHDDPEFIEKLREHNLQREKTNAERLREEIISANPDDAYRQLKQHRAQESRVHIPVVEIVGTKTRSEITTAKYPFLNAAINVLRRLRSFWPLTVRQIHYQLLNDPPLIHAKKPNSQYQNRQADYKALCELLARARLAGYIPMEAITDDTRPVTLWAVHPNTQPFFREQIESMFQGYYRNLMQSQPNHVEVVGEKNTVASILKQVVRDYTIPLTIGRGYSSVPPRYAIAERYRKSGKEKLILLVLSDFDPDGEEICHSLARSMRDDFGIEKISLVKVALTHSQVQSLNLIPSMEAKKSSANYSKFVKKYGPDVYELEAVAPVALQQILRQAIGSVIDVALFNAEVDQEKQDAADIFTLRHKVRTVLQRENLLAETTDTQ